MLFRSVYLFDPIFYEANESSSTCGPGFTLKVETITPPFWVGKNYAAFREMQADRWNSPNFSLGRTARNTHSPVMIFGRDKEMAGRPAR